MGVLKLEGFAGMWPARDPRALPPNAAVDATNIRVGGGAYLKGIHTSASFLVLNAATKSVFRIPLPGANTLINSYWMQFADADTDVVRAPVVNDQYERFYWASPSTGLRFATKAQIIAGGAGFDSGVLAPTAAPTLTVVAGTGHLDPDTGLNDAPETTRAYAVSFINFYGEESQLGPTVEATGHVDQDWLLTNIPQPGSPGTRASYQTIRLYRTVTGLTSGVTSFYKVVDLAIGTTFYTDRLTDAVVSGQVSAENIDWAPAPTGLQGLVAMPNGIFVSWKDNNLYFSENYRPHVWPPEYAITVDFPIVGLGVFGNTCVVCTTGSPFAVSGVKSNAMSLIKTDARLPCLSRGSIVSAPEGVYYASEQGLVLFGSNGVQLVTEDLITREQWRADYAPATIRAMFLQGEYVAIRTPPSGTSQGFRFMPGDASKRGVSKFDVNIGVTYLGVEPYTGRPVAIYADHHLYEWEEPTGVILAYTWLSPEYVYPQPTNFGVAQAFFDNSAGPVHARIWATLRGNDGSKSRTLVFDGDLAASGQSRKLPSGFKSDVWQIELSGTAELQSFLLATSAAELRSA